MSRPLVRVKIAGEAFGFRAAVAPPNRPMLARGNEIGKRLSEWLGRFVAKPSWSGDAIEFFVRDENAKELAGLAGEPVTSEELKGPLRREFAEFQTKLRDAAAQASADQALYDHVCRGLLDVGGGEPGTFIKLGCQLFKYQDVSGRWRLTWCYGYEPQVTRGDARALACSNDNCLHLHMRHPGAEAKCPRCGRPDPVPPPSRRGRKVALALLLLLVTLGATGAGAAYWLRPSAVVTGRVARQGTQQPVADAVVHLEGTDRQTVTDAEGVFRLEGLPNGMRRISATAPGYAATGIEVELQRRQETSVELTLAGAARIVGKVLHRFAGQEIPIAGAAVRVSTDERDTNRPSALTNDKGEFEITGLFPGETRVAVEARGYHSSEEQGTAAFETPAPLNVVLRGSERVAGRIVFAIDGKLTVADADIQVAGEADAKARSDGSGNFLLRDLPPAEVKLDVKAAGFKPQSATARGGDTGLVIALEGDAILAGEVLRADTKAPVADAEVRLPGTPFAARTGENGKFRILAVRSGPARINASAPGLAAVVTQELAAAQETSVKLLLAGTLTASGRVLDARDKKPLAGATVTVPDLGLKTTTDAAGSFTLPGLAQGAFKIVASAPATFPAIVDFQATPERTKIEDIELQPAAAAKGRVVTGKGSQPVAGITVAVSGTEAAVTTNDQGEFHLYPLPLGKATFTVSAEGYFGNQREVVLEAGDQALEDIQLAPLASCRGFVRRALDQKPLAGVAVALKETGERVLTNEEGLYRFARAPAGIVSIATSLEGYESQQWRQALRAGDQKLEDALLEGMAPAQGVTLDAFDKDKAVAGVSLKVTVGDYNATLESKPNGGFVIGKLPTNSLVEVVASKPGYQDVTVRKRVMRDDGWIEIPLPRLIKVAGVAIDADTRSPIAKANIAATTPLGAVQLTTDGQGRFQVEGVPVGKLELQVDAPRYAPETIGVQIEPNAAALTVPLKPLRRYEGSVFDATDSRKGVANARVKYTIGGFQGSATTGPLGSFTIELPKGQGTVEIGAAGYLNLSEPVQIDGQRRTLIYKLSRGRRIAGVVVNAVNNKPVPAALIGIGDGNEQVTALSDGEGRFQIEAAPTSAKELEVNVPGFEPLRIAMPSGSAESLRIVLSPLLADGEVRIVVTWDRQPPDLDAHLLGPLPGGERFHVSFDNRTALGATLDVDAKKGLGPETISVRTRPGKYSYFVTHNDSLGTNQGERLGQSNAQVRVYYKGAGANKPFVLPPKVSGPAWYVLDVVVEASGKITVQPMNQFAKDLPVE